MAEKNAIEKAKRELNPGTSNDEDAWMLAELIHGCALQIKAIRFDARGNGRKLTDRYERQVNTPGGPITGYVPAENGKAEDPAGRKCRTIEQQIGELQKRETELWEQAEEDQIGANAVAEALREVQKISLERMKERKPE